MIRKIAALALLALATTAFFTACAESATTPYSLSGNMTAEQKSHYTDDKGRFHADLADQDRPLR